jgi:hypothetical protein
MGNYSNSKLLAFEKNVNNEELSASSSFNGNGCIWYGNTHRLSLSRYVRLENNVNRWPQADVNERHICDSETFIKIKYPGFEQPGHDDAPTKLSIIFSSIENVCLS